MKSFLFKYRIIFFGLSILLLTMLAFYTNRPASELRPAEIKNKKEDALKSYVALEPELFLLDSTSVLDLTANILFSNNARYIYSLGEINDRYYISKYELKDRRAVNVKDERLMRLNNNYIYEIALLKDQFSENIMAVCFPFSFEKETKHWVYDSLNFIEVILYNKDLQEIDRQKIKYQCSEPVLSDDLPYFQNAKYAIRNDSIFLMDGEIFDMSWCISKGILVEFSGKSEVLQLISQWSHYRINQESSALREEVEFYDPNSDKTFRYKLRTPSRKIINIDSGFISVTDMFSIEKYRIAF